MRRSWSFIVTLALLTTLVSADVASAKKSRSKGASSRKPTAASSRGKQVRKKTLASQGKRGRRLARSKRRSRRSYEPSTVIASGSPRPSPGIPTERITEIQTALIKAGFMDGPASGLYDDPTIEAMKQFQSKNGLSQTGLPSARLLKKLGVAKRSNDGYAVPVKSVSENERKRPGN